MGHKHKFAVIGLGLFGSAIARKLSAKGAEVIAIDNDENNVENISSCCCYGRRCTTKHIIPQKQHIEMLGEAVESLRRTEEMLR